MGFRYRRTKSKGPLRVSVGKRGVSASVGTKGFRVGITSSGKIRTTNSIPGTGISYTNTFGGKKKKGGQRGSTYSSPSPYQGNTQINYLKIKVSQRALSTYFYLFYLLRLL